MAAPCLNWQAALYEVCNVERWTCHHDVLPVCEDHFTIPEEQVSEVAVAVV